MRKFISRHRPENAILSVDTSTLPQYYPLLRKTPESYGKTAISRITPTERNRRAETVDPKPLRRFITPDRGWGELGVFDQTFFEKVCVAPVYHAG